MEARAGATAKFDRLCGVDVPPLIGGDIVLAPAHVAFVAEVLCPLLSSMAQMALMAMPERLPAFFLQWLLTYSKAPTPVVDVVGDWLQVGSLPPSRYTSENCASPAGQEEVSTGRRDSIRSRVKRSRASQQRTPPDVPISDAVEMIRGVPLFQQLNDEDVEALASCAEICCFDADSEVVRRGARHDALHMILSGEGHVSIPQLVGTLCRGDSFGEHAIVKRHLTSTHTITAQGGGGGDEDGRLVTLAIKYDECARLGILSRLRTKRTAGLTTNVVTRQGPNATGRRKSRRGVAQNGWPTTPPANGPPAPAASSTAPAPAEAPAELSQEDRQLIIQAIRANAHFSEWLQLSDKQVEMMADMMRLTTVQSGQEVVKKGEHGSKFYVVNDGILEVVSGDTQTEMLIKVRLRSGDSFGELALLYNCPRKATVRATRPCKLWVLDRARFRAVMRLRSETRIREYERLMASVPLLNERLTTAERGVLAGALEESFFVRGEEVVTQADPAHVFFIVFEGCCEVRINGAARGFLQKGNVFWERTLQNKECHAVTVVVTSETATVLTFDGASCHALQGVGADSANGQVAAVTVCGSEKSAVQGSSATGGGNGASTPRGKQLEPGPSCPIEFVRRLTGDARDRLPLPKVPWEDLEALGTLGYGSFGCVTLQRDRRTGRLYAMKAISKGYIKREGMEQHVRNERKTMEILESKFLVKMHCTYKCPRYVYFLLDPALGGELYEVYAQNEHMFGSVAHAKFYAVCCGLGVQHMHDRHIIYRDLKLENVLLYSNGYACLTDMGLAKIVIGKTYTVCGTADYFAPETLRQTGHNRAVDWWALGVMLFIMMSGRSPFDAEDVMQIYRNIVKGFKRDTFPLDFDEDLTDLILGLCRKKPEKRIAMAPGGVANVRAHAWFHEFPWDLVARRTCRAPYQPPEPNFASMRETLLQAGIPNRTPCAREGDSESEVEDTGWDADF